MKSSNWKDTAELIGIVAIVASLIFVGMQLRQDQSIAEAQIYSQSNQLAIDLANLINEDRDIWVRGIAGDDLTVEEEAVFENIYMAIYLNYGGLWQRANRLSTRSPESAARQLAYQILTHPGLRRMWEKHTKLAGARNDAFSGQYPDFGFRVETERFLDELDSRAVAPLDDPLKTPW